MNYLVLCAAFLISVSLCHAADFLDLFKKRPATNTSETALSAFSQDQVADALKQALSKGVQSAVTNLGRTNGFLANPDVKIPMPENLQKVEKTLRALKQEKLADDFVASMNHAAEQAVPEALPIVTDALKTMTVDDARKLVAGGNDSATQFFKEKGEEQIQEKMLPIIKEATARTGATSYYKKIIDQAGGSGGFLGRLNVNTASLDVDQYVTRKASDGLFKMIADEEKRIRENPAARTTELLEKVFGAVKGTSPK